jgi:hypothetical protein
VVVGPGDDRTAEGRRLRASDTDREQVIDVLKAAFVQGRVTKEEFDLRVGLVLRSQTYAGLDALTADIPAGLVAEPAPGMPPIPDTVPAARHVRARERAVVATSTFAILAWIVALFAGPDAGAPFVAGTASVLVSLFLVGTLMAGSRHHPSGPQAPGQRALGTGRGTAYRVASAASEKRRPDAGRPQQATGRLPSRPQASWATTPA